MIKISFKVCYMSFQEVLNGGETIKGFYSAIVCKQAFSSFNKDFSMPEIYWHNYHNFHENEMNTFFNDIHHMVNGQKR